MDKPYITHKRVLIPFLISILFFIRKGIQYAFLNNHLILYSLLSILVLLIVSNRINQSLFRIILRCWFLIIIIWSLIRIAISIVHMTYMPFDISWHLTQQFGIWGLSLSMIMLFIGIIGFTNIKRLKGNLDV